MQTLKFNSFDDIIKFLYGKDLTKLTFTISEDTESCSVDNQECGTSIDAPQPQTPDAVQVVFNSLANKPVIEFETGEKTYLLVEEFTHIPNTCSTTKIQIGNSEIMLGVCENEEGLPVAKFDVIVNDKLYTATEFILVTDKEKYKNTICINAA